METKHTKAPWAWQKFGTDYCLTAQHGFREIIIGAQKGRYTEIPFVAMNKDGVMRSIDPQHPNAKLIAASPEMLEALIEAEKALTHEYWMTGEAASVIRAAIDKSPHIIKIRAAIKKATE